MKENNNIKTPEEVKEILKTLSIDSSEKKVLYKTCKNDKGYIEAEHRIIWKNNFGEIPIGGVIHHIDLDKNNNNINNLMFFPSHVAHMNYHKDINKKKKKL